MPANYGPLRLIALVLCTESCPAESGEAGIYVISSEISIGFRIRVPFYVITRLNPVAGVQDSIEERESIIKGLPMLKEAVAAHMNANEQIMEYLAAKEVDKLLPAHIYFNNVRHRSGKITVLPRDI